MFRIISVAAVILCFLFSGGCGENKAGDKSSGVEGPDYGDTFIEADIADAITLNPLLYTDSASGDIIDNIFNGLIKYDPFGEIISDMAEKWEIKENKDIVFIHISPSSQWDANILKQKYMKENQNFAPADDFEIHDGIDSDRKLILEVKYKQEVEAEELEKWKKFGSEIEFVNYRYDVVFNLKKDIRWSDGVDFTSADVLFTYRKIIEPKTGCPRKGNYKMIKNVEAPDRYTLTAEYYIPFAPALQSWMTSIVPKHVLENENMIDTKFNRNPVGTGPYILEKWSADEYILLKSNHDYFEGRPYIDKIMVKIIPDSSQQFLDLQNGLLDYMAMTSDQYKKQADTPEFRERFNIYRTPSSRYYSFVGYNCAREPFDDKRVRQALSYGMDVKQLIESVFYGYGVKITGPFPLTSWAYNPNANDYPYNPEKAGELLDEAGWKDTDGDGIRDRKGKKLKVELVTNNGNSEREYMVKIIGDYWKKIGVDCTVMLEQWENFLTMQDKGEFDAVLLGWNLATDPDIYNIWHSSNIPNDEHPSSFNFQRYSNPEVDRLLEQGRYTFDQEKRKECYWKVHEIIAEDQPYTFLMAEDSFSVIDRRFRGIEKKGNSIFWNFNKWYVPSDLVRYK